MPQCIIVSSPVSDSLIRKIEMKVLAGAYKLGYYLSTLMFWPYLAKGVSTHFNLLSFNHYTIPSLPSKCSSIQHSLESYRHMVPQAWEVIIVSTVHVYIYRSYCRAVSDVNSMKPICLSINSMSRFYGGFICLHSIAVLSTNNVAWLSGMQASKADVRLIKQLRQMSSGMIEELSRPLNDHRAQQSCFLQCCWVRVSDIFGRGARHQWERLEATGICTPDMTARPSYQTNEDISRYSTLFSPERHMILDLNEWELLEKREKDPLQTAHS